LIVVTDNVSKVLNFIPDHCEKWVRTDLSCATMWIDCVFCFFVFVRNLFTRAG